MYRYLKVVFISFPAAEETLLFNLAGFDLDLPKTNSALKDSQSPFRQLPV